jgi:hypothetical protein
MILEHKKFFSRLMRVCTARNKLFCVIKLFEHINWLFVDYLHYQKKEANDFRLLRKGTGSQDGLSHFLYVWIVLDLKKLPGWFLNFLCLQRFSIEVNLFLLVNANTDWLIMLVATLIYCRPEVT